MVITVCFSPRTESPDGKGKENKNPEVKRHKAEGKTKKNRQTRRIQKTQGVQASEK